MKKKGILLTAILASTLGASTASYASSAIGTKTVTQGVEIKGMCTNIPEVVTFASCKEQGIKTKVTQADAQKAGLLYNNPLTQALSSCGSGFSFPGMPSLTADLDLSLPSIDICNSINEAVDRANKTLNENVGKIDDLIQQELEGQIGNDYIGAKGGVQTSGTTGSFERTPAQLQPQTKPKPKSTTSTAPTQKPTQSSGVQSTKPKGSDYSQLYL